MILNLKETNFVTNSCLRIFLCNTLSTLMLQIPILLCVSYINVLINIIYYDSITTITPFGFRMFSMKSPISYPNRSYIYKRLENTSTILENFDSPKI